MNRLLLPIAGLAALFFWGCPATPSQSNVDYLRSPVTFRVDTVIATHPYCSSSQPSLSADSCTSLKKYVLRWERPQDTTGFVEYRIYLDTNPPNAPEKSWDDIRQDRTFASAIVSGAGGASDSLVLYFNNAGFHPTQIQNGASQVVPFDTTGRVDPEGRLVFGIVASYKGGANGQPRYTWIITNDRFPPFPLQPLFTPLARSLEIQWERPLDPTSFFDPGADSGVIRRYVLKVVRGGILNANRNTPFAPQIHFTVGGTDRSSEVTSLPFTNSRGAAGYRFVLPDSQGIFNPRSPDPRDSINAFVNGLSPQDTVDVSLWAVDNSGNFTDSTIVTRVILTDTTEPLMPKLRLLAGSVTHNQFIYSFTASRDRIQSGAQLVPADSPNANILEYHITRKRLSGSVGGTANKDSILKVTDRTDTVFVDTVRYLPPGANYRIYVQAMDSTGHLSPTDSIDVSTLPVTFPIASSTCPSGFVPIPAGSFLLGDVSNTDPDELPSKRHFIRSYCIENYEHQNPSSDAFQTRVTWQQAEKICQDISPSDKTHLCTEAEWERACEGTDSLPLTYGFQSENPNNPAALLNTCNIGTGDSAMATTPGLRNPTCLNREGVFDMSGNLAEWVLDPYAANAYSQAPDTLTPGKPLAGQAVISQGDTVHGYRGEYYLNSRQASTVLLHLARCSNRDTPKQVRPTAYPGCLDSANSRMVLIYNNSGAPRCLTVPDSLRARNITGISPSRDSTQILLLLSGVAKPFVYTLPYDSAYRTFRPISTSFTTKTMAAITFENTETDEVIPDTLDATEMTDTSDAALSVIFSREISPPWTVRKVNGHYAIKFLYAYSSLHNLPARRQYSNPALGFRCCSLPRP